MAYEGSHQKTKAYNMVGHKRQKEEKDAENLFKDIVTRFSPMSVRKKYTLYNTLEHSKKNRNQFHTKSQETNSIQTERTPNLNTYLCSWKSKKARQF